MNKPILATAAALAVIAFGWFLLEPPPAPPTLVVTPGAALPPPPPEEKTELRTSTDAAEIFRRAFWREPAADDRILHAERREWVSEQDGVRRWQWFLAVQPSPAFTAWLRDENPFLLHPVDSPQSGARVAAAPDWFPQRDTLPRCQVAQTADHRLTTILDPATGRLYATDSGAGFALTAKTPAVPTPDFPPSPPPNLPRR